MMWASSGRRIASESQGCRHRDEPAARYRRCMKAVLRFVGRVVMGRMTRALTALLGLSVLALLHWSWVVVAGRELPGALASASIAAGILAANVALIPLIRLRRHDPGATHRILAVYYAASVATILVAGGLGLAWLLAIPAGSVAWLSGASWDEAVAGFRLLSLGCVGGVAALVLWGFTFGQSRIRHESFTLVLKGLSPRLSGLRVLQLSDLHLGNGIAERRLQRLVEIANGKGADLIVLTGDLFDSDPSVLEMGARGLGALRAPLGVYAILGNHDVYVGADRVARALAEHAPSLRLLRHDVIRLPVPEPFYLAGFDDPSDILWTARDIEVAELEELARKCPDDGPTLLLIHRPELFGQARRLGFPLVLAGHTHGGQVAVPFFERPFNVARLITRYDRGLFREGGSILYVNRGLGVAGPGLRIAAPREMAIFELQAPPAAGNAPDAARP